jgi:hypothetical protein
LKRAAKSGPRLRDATMPGDQQCDAAPLQLAQDRVQLLPRLRRRQAPQHVVGAERDDGELRLLGSPSSVQASRWRPWAAVSPTPPHW